MHDIADLKSERSLFNLTRLLVLVVHKIENANGLLIIHSPVGGHVILLLHLQPLCVVPWFQIQDQTLTVTVALTLNNTSSHTLTRS